ncbi:DEKNAAC101389 [Brettanomyces naardenensis]|uniref:DEKNAAC101389 n=1 Tax=Brettanomyces naardenensis TaxID=13370 RepID=A0A448YHY0_BRENA|nr:DEKNAAC101389 [Brettanomyces naardenensis]
MPVFREYGTPGLQAKLFTNIIRFLKIYKEAQSTEYQSMIIRLDTILDLFVNTITREIGLQIDKKEYGSSRSLISALSDLRIDNAEIAVDPLNSLLEFFISRYSEGFTSATDDKAVDVIFVEAGKSGRKGAVNGYQFRFDRVDKLFDEKIKAVLDDDLAEIANIFNTKSADDTIINEVPIILKVVETFLSSYLIGGLVDKIIDRAKEIDQTEGRVSFEKKQVEQVIMDEQTIENVPSADQVWQRDDNDISSKLEQVDLDSNQDTEEEEGEGHINIMNANSLFFQCVPYIHYKLISVLHDVQYPKTVVNAGTKQRTEMDYVKVACEFVNFYYEPYLLEFSEQLPRQCHESLVYVVDLWESNKIGDQKKMEDDIMKMVDDREERKKNAPFDILSTFTNIFKFRSNNKSREGETKAENENERRISKMAANLQILKSNVEGIKSLMSVDLTVLVLQHVKNSYDLLLGLTKYSTTDELNRQLYQTCSDIFIDMLTVLVRRHIQAGFSEALTTLRNYKPTDFEDSLKATSVAVAPLNSFIELVNVGDLILQMVEVFYQRELVSNGIVKSKSGKYKDFLSMSQCEKVISKFESILDTYVADGLDISIGVIMNEVNYTIVQSGIDESTYNMTSMEQIAKNQDKASEWVQKSVEILGTHFQLLEKSIAKEILDVFKQEIGERMVAIFIKLLTKRFVISVLGAIQFITDVNFFYDFFQKYRIKPAVQYFVSFKQISQLYLIDCLEDKKERKELGRLVVEIGRDNGIFSPEEVYQFVTRRSDWGKIKKSVDKIMYGFSPDDCTIM